MLVSISKGQQVTIPSKIRKRFKLDIGTRVEIIEEKDKIIIKPIDDDIESLFKEARKKKPKLNLSAKQMDKMVEDEVLGH